MPVEHYCSWCQKTYACPDEPDRAGCEGVRVFMCRDCALSPPPIENYRPEETE